MLRMCGKRRTLRAIKLFIVLWTAIIVYLYFSIDGSGIHWTLSSKYNSALRIVMRNKDYSGNKSLFLPLNDLILPQHNTLSLFHLPLRQRGILYTEVTSANPDTSYPLAPDFTFHLEYHDDHVLLYEDYGPGCVHRLYLFPSLTTHADLLYKMTAKDLQNMSIVFTVDGVNFRYSVSMFMEGREWPFLRPMNTQHKYLASGMGSYTSICYQISMKISYFPAEPLPMHLLQTMVQCSQNDMLCPVHIYSSISRTKFTPNTRVESYTDTLYKSRGEQTAVLLDKPDENGPGHGSACHLKCIELCKGCKRVILSHSGPGVLASMFMRLYVTSSHELRPDWSDVLLSAGFDGIDVSIDKIPLGNFFGFTGSLNEFSAVAYGKRKHSCIFDDDLLELPEKDITGYFYYPMPFWHGAKMTLEGSKFIDAPLLVCYQLDVVDNYYVMGEAGYFGARKSYFDQDVTSFRELLSIQGYWGQVVGVFMEVDNLRVINNVPVNERWPALQADAVIYIDGMKSASVLGTGLEDYFSYAHGFNMAENTTYGFVGNYHASPRRKEPLTWHCYRLHILDPVYFLDSIQFIMEGTSKQHFQSKHAGLSYEAYYERRQSGLSCLSHTVFYYTGLLSGLTPTDSLHLAETTSEMEHRFEIVYANSRTSGTTFILDDKRYLGAGNKNETVSVKGREFQPGTKITFILMCIQQNNGVVLRRDFHSLVNSSWNEKSLIWLDGELVGTWFIPMGATSELYSLRQADFGVGRDRTNGRTKLTFTLEILTLWRDIGYRLYTIH